MSEEAVVLKTRDCCAKPCYHKEYERWEPQGGRSAAKSAVVRRSGQTEVTLNIEPGGALEGRVVDGNGAFLGLVPPAGLLGILLAEHDEDVARLQLKDQRGVLIRSVLPGEPADKGGVKANDVIVALGGTRLTTPRDLQRVVSSTPVGTKVRVVLLRDGKEQELEITIGLYKDPDAKK